MTYIHCACVSQTIRNWVDTQKGQMSHIRKFKRTFTVLNSFLSSCSFQSFVRTRYQAHAGDHGLLFITLTVRLWVSVFDWKEREKAICHFLEHSTSLRFNLKGHFVHMLYPCACVYQTIRHWADTQKRRMSHI